MKFMFRKQSHYLDYAAAAPLTPNARRAFLRALALSTGNASAIHSFGVRSAQMLADARREVARCFGVRPSEVIFTSSGTESDNLAILGVIDAYRAQYPNAMPHVVSTRIEHPAVLEPLVAYEAQGLCKLTLLEPDERGLISLLELRNALTPETILVSIGYANSEIGTVQPLREIAKEIRRFKKEIASAVYPLFHTDAAQAVGTLDIQMDRLGVDLLSCNSSKIGGPLGVGALIMQGIVPLAPRVFGGGHEQGLRSGTSNVPAIVGFAEALTDARKHQAVRQAKLQNSKDAFLAYVQEKVPGVRTNGRGAPALAGTVSLSVPYIDSELLVIELDAKGFAVSRGSACASATDTGSHVLAALYGADDAKKWGTVRISFGQDTSRKTLYACADALAHIQKKYAVWKS
jgi:cysteine desulfurase